MARRRIGQEALALPGSGQAGRGSTLDQLATLIDWAPVEVHLNDVYAAAKGEPAWPPLALFRALLIAVWYDLSDVKLAEALDNRASFRRFCGFAAHEALLQESAGWTRWPQPRSRVRRCGRSPGVPDRSCG